MPGWEGKDAEEKDIQVRWKKKLEKARENPLELKEDIIDPEKAGIDMENQEKDPLAIKGLH